MALRVTPTNYGGTGDLADGNQQHNHHLNLYQHHPSLHSAQLELSSFEQEQQDSSNNNSRGSSLIALRCLASRRFLLVLIVLLGAFAVVVTALLVVVSIRHTKETEDNDFLNQHITWRDKCERKCHAKIPFDVPPLLLISLDGFRADYLERELTPAVSRILNCGAQAEYLLPSYPSKTFPNHFTIVTGLYPEAHGIVDNSFWDEGLAERRFSKASADMRWYHGEPIWNTVTKNGKKAGIFFWPGSEVPIQGMRPAYRYVYNATTPFSKRVDQVGGVK